MTGDRNRRASVEIRALAEREMTAAFRSPLVDYLLHNDYRLRGGDTVISLAAEFGFCYGVDRAVEYAYAARHRYPDRQIWITGEIIHNPRVNRRLQEMGVRFLPESASGEERFGELSKGDVILIPAFGADAREMAWLLDRGYELVDTTCGSVLNVWKRVRQYARDGFTSVIHGKYDHEETRATCSQVASENPGGHYLVLLDLEETKALAAMIAGADFDGFFPRFANAASEGFDPEKHLDRIGLANQTTMLESESREIQDVLRRGITRRFGDENLGEHFRAFDTICSATEDRQRAVKDLIEDGLDRIIVIGGYNSSNTGHLVEIASHKIPAYHIESADCLLDGEHIRAKPLGEEPRVMTGWLPAGPQTIGVTGGASTPDSVVGRAIERIMELRGLSMPDLAAPPTS